MQAVEIEANIVVVANQFNPSIIDRFWLVRHGILAEEDFLEGCIFAPVVSQVRSKLFNLTVLPEQLQFSPSGEKPALAEVVRLKLGQIIYKLPETPYRAIGLNFNWHLPPTSGDNQHIGRRLFFRSSSGLYKMFDTDDARFGAYLSKDELGCRLKLDIKPITFSRDTDKTQILQFAFNFHRDLSPPNQLDSIKEMLDKWGDAQELAQKIVMQVEEESEAS